MRDFDAHLRSVENAILDAGMYASRIFVMEFAQNSCGVKAELTQIDLALRAARNGIDRARKSYEQSLRDAVEQKMKENFL